MEVFVWRMFAIFVEHRKNVIGFGRLGIAATVWWRKRQQARERGQGFVDRLLGWIDVVFVLVQYAQMIQALYGDSPWSTLLKVIAQVRKEAMDYAKDRGREVLHKQVLGTVLCVWRLLLCLPKQHGRSQHGLAVRPLPARQRTHVALPGSARAQEECSRQNPARSSCLCA